MMLDFFFYGTLRDKDIRRLVLRRVVRCEKIVPATLAGYRRYAVRGAPYPAAVRQPGAEIDGIVVRGLDALDAARLSNFEGDDYLAALCPVALRQDESVEVGSQEAWVFIAGDRVPLAKTPWSLDAWRVAHKRRFLEIAHRRLSAQGDDKMAVQERLWRARLETD